MTWSEMVKAARAAQSLTQAAFSEKYEISKRTIESWEAGIREPAEYIQKALLYYWENHR